MVCCKEIHKENENIMEIMNKTEEIYDNNEAQKIPWVLTWR